MSYILLSLMTCIFFTIGNILFLKKLNKKFKFYNLDSKKVFKSETISTNWLFILQFILYVFSISFMNHTVFYLFIGLLLLTSITILSLIGEMNASLKIEKKKGTK